MSVFIRQPPMFKSEREIVRRVLSPFLKRKNYLVKNFVRLEMMKEKLRKEEVSLDTEEEEFNHPWRPGDIDILFWDMTSGSPTIHAAEVKYFRLRKLPVRSKTGYVPKSQRGKQANVKPHPEAHEGLGQAAMLLSFGVDYVHLIHVFDPMFPTDLTSLFKNTIGKVANVLHLNYHAENPEYFKDPKKEDIATVRARLGLQQASFFSNLKRNPLLYDKEAKIARKIIRKAYRMI